MSRPGADGASAGTRADAGALGRSWLALAATLVATAAVYGPWLGHPFHFDSVLKLEDNPRLRAPAGYFEALASGRYSERAGRLLTNLSYSADYHLHGGDSFGYHLTDLVLHLVVVVLVFALGRALSRHLGGGPWLPLLGASLFALHPLNSEAVNYLNARSNQLVTAFYLVALLLVVRARDAASAGARLRAWSGFVLAAVAALLSKELGVTLALMAPLLWWWTAPTGGVRDRGEHRAAVAALAALGGLAALVAWATGAYREVGRAVFEMGPHVSGQWTTYLVITALGQAEIFMRYLGLALWPVPGALNVDHRAVLHLHERLSRVEDAGATAAVLALPIAASLALLFAAVWAFRHRRSAPLSSFLVLWPLVTHAPTSLVPRGEVMVEYRTYLPMVGVCLLFALGLQRLGTRLASVVTAGAPRAGAVVLLGLLAAGTIARNQVWASQELLWRDALAKSPDNYRAHHSLAAVLGAAGKTDEAVVHYHRALELFPPDPEANNNLGNVLLARGEVDEAKALYERAIARRPAFAEAHANLGRAFAASGDHAGALPHYRRALELNPMQAETHNNLAGALAALGRTAEAREHFLRALELSPTMATAHANLAGLLLAEGDVAGAERSYRDALAQDPDLALAHTGLGGLLAGQQRFDEAIASFRRAVELEPDSAVAHNNLGSALAYRGELPAAIALFERALALQPDYADAAANLERARALQAGQP